MLNRFLYSSNGVISDFSRELFRYSVGTATIPAFVGAQDYLYVAARAPFNHFFFKLDTPNTNPTALSLDVWDGTKWCPTYENVDETKGFTQSGYLYFVPNKNTPWSRESTNFEGEQVSGLTTISIYDMYWLRISSSADFSADVVFSWCGQKFSDDFDLGAEFPDLTRQSMLDSFNNGSGKTDWEEQHAKAAELMTSDLITQGIITFKEQILIKEEFITSSVQKVAQIIYTSFGDDYKDQAAQCLAEYRSRLSKSVYRVDRTGDGILNDGEDRARQGFLSR